MVLSLFESADQRRNDDRDLKAMFRKYDTGLVEVLQARVDDETLTGRDRKHWARLLRKAKARY